MLSRRALLAVSLVCFALAGLLLSCVTAGAQAREPLAFRLLGPSSVALAGADVAQTMWASGHGGAQESNPVLAPLAGSPIAFGVVRVGGSAAINAWTARLYRTRPKAAWTVRVVFVALQATVVAWNARQLAQMK
jgi:uncharacterized membrane protein